jgi:hypothetical protein
LSELADYRKIHGHCNVPQRYSENAKLGRWVADQRRYCRLRKEGNYRLRKEGKASPMTLSRIQELESLGFEWGVCATAWEDRLSELADYRKIHGHCNVPKNYSENTKLAAWVKTQRGNYRLHLEENTSPMTTFRIQELESLGFEWRVCITAWKDRLSELADYRKIHGHCNVPTNYRENAKLGTWVTNQKNQYRLHKEGKTSPMTTFRIQELESLGFEWRVCASAWQDHLSELAEYHKIHGHCNVPKNYSENAKLGHWVGKQRGNYRLRKEGKASPMTLSRIQVLESLGFESGVYITVWEDRLSELAEYHKIHGHCNVPKKYSENAKLGMWVMQQRGNYRLLKEGKKSSLTTCRIQELESLGFEWRVRITAWEDRLSELTDYQKSHGHCNVPKNYSENAKLANWVGKQRRDYRLRKEGKASPMTLSRIQVLESLGFESGVYITVWEDRLSELADYRKIHRHCNVPRNYSENNQLGMWVMQQRGNYRLLKEGKKSSLTTFRIQELESLGFEWRVRITAWEDRLSELADYQKSHGHCNVPRNYIENTKLATWVAHQRGDYRLHKEGKTSPMTTFRIQELESLGFEWGVCITVWEDRLSELVDYRKIHGHCNVPHKYRENAKLASWVNYQRRNYKLHLERKTSSMTLCRIHELECLDFMWKARIGRNKGTAKRPSLDDDATLVREPAVEAPEHVQTTSLSQEDFSGRESCNIQVDVALEPEESDWNGEDHLTYIPGRTEEI